MHANDPSSGLETLAPRTALQLGLKSIVGAVAGPLIKRIIISEDVTLCSSWIGPVEVA